jgi:hypothetical protein
MPDRAKALGHVANIFLFDEATVLIPFNENEAQILMSSLNGTIRNLEKSGDFPEKEKYEKLLANIISASWILSAQKK